ncbi:Uncharacterised protein [Providencia stuartii]|nr:Uncharacterised protein [Providencia stuartii]
MILCVICEGVPQDALHHAEGDVATHTQMVLAALEALPEYQQLPVLQQNIVWAAALLHDVEKRTTTREDEKRAYYLSWSCEKR